jgi:hypothetical protein
LRKIQPPKTAVPANTLGEKARHPVIARVETRQKFFHGKNVGKKLLSPENDRKCCQIIQWTQRLNKCRESGAGGRRKIPRTRQSRPRLRLTCTKFERFRENSSRPKLGVRAGRARSQPSPTCRTPGTGKNARLRLWAAHPTRRAMYFLRGNSMIGLCCPAIWFHRKR